ncbi:hypothetical protein [Paenibacillus sp. 1P07SE]|uniref:hypothetical protein n=1 Tax=Paenibacillus sp. 1P07SE TaxID=3132209 RepID=UPI0039A607AF
MTYESAGMADANEQRLAELLHPANLLCRSDVVWLLAWIKKKAAELDASTLDSSQPPLLSAFHCFAEAAMLILGGKPSCQQELSRLRELLAEAVQGMQRMSKQQETRHRLQSTPSS